MVGNYLFDMEYREFCSVIETQVKGIDVKDRAVSSFVRGAYESLPKGLTPIQERAYANTWASGYLSGRLGTHMRMRPVVTGLARKAAG